MQILIIYCGIPNTFKVDGENSPANKKVMHEKVIRSWAQHMREVFQTSLCVDCS